MDLPEAPVSINFIMDWMTKEVKSIQVTIRDKDENAAKNRTLAMMKGLGAHAPEAPQPIPETPTPPATWEEVGQDAKEILYGPEDTETWEKPTGEIKFTSTGKRYLNVKGGRWLKYGASAWPEVIPFQGWENWPPGQVFMLPKNAIVRMKEKDGKLVPDKVIGFEE